MLYCLGTGTRRSQGDFRDFLNKAAFVFVDKEKRRFCVRGGFKEFAEVVLDYLKAVYPAGEEIWETINLDNGNNFVRSSAIVRTIVDHAEQLDIDLSDIFIGYLESLDAMDGNQYGEFYLYRVTGKAEKITAGGYYNALIPGLLAHVDENFQLNWEMLSDHNFMIGMDLPLGEVSSYHTKDGHEVFWKYRAGFGSAAANFTNLKAILEKLENLTAGFEVDNYVMFCSPVDLENFADVSVSITSAPTSPLIATKYLQKLLYPTGTCKQLILTGAPGTGKTYSVRNYVESITDKAHYQFVQFHSSYDYSDFVEGLRPVNLGDAEHPQTSFVRLDGIFKKFCRKAAAAEKTHKENENVPEERFYFIIDEVNRADLSRVFGELMFCLEESHRGENECVQTQYHNLPTYDVGENGKPTVMTEDVFKEGFYIPENVIIIGTMNDIDRSVETFDFALRRRFRWVEVKAEDVMEDALQAMLVQREKLSAEELTELLAKIERLNKAISGEIGKGFGLSDAYHIGPSYFKNYTSDTSAAQYFEDELQPILSQYVLGRSGAEKFVKDCKAAFVG